MSSREPEQVSKPDQEVQEAIRAGQIEEENGAPDEDGEEFVEVGDEDEDLSDTEDERPSMAVDTAFVVFAQEGAGYAIAQLGEVSIVFEGTEVFLEPMKKATVDDMYRYSSEVCKDIQVSATATAVVQQMAAYTAQMQQQLQTQALAQQVQQRTGQGPGGIHVPGR